MKQDTKVQVAKLEPHYLHPGVMPNTEDIKGIPTQYFDLKVHGHIVTVLKSKQDWISRIPRDLPSDRKPSDVFLWVDKFGMALSTGADFQAAKEAESYPVTVYRLTRLSDSLEAIRD